MMRPSAETTARRRSRKTDWPRPQVKPGEPETRLCVANFTANTGYAWDYIERVYARIADHLATHGVRTLVAYPEMAEPPRTLAGSAAEPVVLGVALDEAAAVRATEDFIRREGVRALYLTDRPARSRFYRRLRRGRSANGRARGAAGEAPSEGRHSPHRIPPQCGGSACGRGSVCRALCVAGRISQCGARDDGVRKSRDCHIRRWHSRHDRRRRVRALGAAGRRGGLDGCDRGPTRRCCPAQSTGPS